MRHPLALVLVLALAVPALAKPRLEVVLSPSGGFNPENKKPMRLSDGRMVPPDLNVLADDMIRSTKPGGRIEIAMYAFSDDNALVSLVDRARAGVAIRMVLDACAEWTASLRAELFANLKAEKEKADREGKPFDVQVKTISCGTFKKYGRGKTLPGGEEISGTMHEKFGVIFHPKRSVPSDGFCGSSNFAKAAATKYAENRVFFYDDPVSVSQLHEEFQRLWRWWGWCAFGECEEVAWINNTEAGHGQVKFVFNGETRAGGDTGNPREVKWGGWRRIDGAIEKVLESLAPEGTMDFAMFSFTHHGLKDKILEMAAKHPKARIRILFDHSMLADDIAERPGVLGPGLERDVKARKLKNVEVRYKFRSNTYCNNPDDPKKPPEMNHFRSLLLHHKFVIVNGNLLANGSYNWSQGAERRNLENLQIFDGRDRAQAKVIEAFAREFDTLWNSKNPEDPALVDQFRPNPEVVSGDQGRALSKRILAALRLPGAREIMMELDKAMGGGTVEDSAAADPTRSVEQLAAVANMPRARVLSTLSGLRAATMLRRTPGGRWALAD